MSKEICKSIYFFDLDDTLIETTQFNEAVVRNSLKVLEQFKIDISQADAWEFYLSIYQDIKASSDMMKMYFEKLYKIHSDKFENEEFFWRVCNVGVCKYEEFFEKNIKNFIPKNTIKTIEKIIKSGSKVGIISQGRPGFQMLKVKNLGIEKYFDETLRFYFEKKSEDNYKLVIKEIKRKYPNIELFIIGDREDIDILRPRKLGFKVIRILGKSKYAHIKTETDYLEFKSFKEFYKSLN
jgi:FMN phosphatase YigB (HAD superfamily)